MLEAVIKANRQGDHKGVYAVCSVNRFAIRAALEQACRDRWPVLIEATAQQVNPAGGYSGMTPVAFAALVEGEAAAVGLDAGLILLGGDHLGPYPWSHQPAAAAMAQARGLVEAAVAAGFAKLHIDATAVCRDDPRLPDGSLPVELIVERTVDLMAVAEKTARRNRRPPPLYVVGSDVPAPGGAAGSEEPARVSDPAAVGAVLAAIRRALAARGLTAVWPRVLAVVARSGADFGNRCIVPYDRAAAQSLVSFITRQPGMVYEAHSTDFQPPAALHALVADHFAILKVGPRLTYAFRETVFGLAAIEQAMLGTRKAVQRSHLAETLEAAMTRDPRHWRQHYRGTADELQWLRVNAYTDRIRYYWAYPRPAAAFNRLLSNLRRYPPSPQLIEVHLPQAYPAVANGRLAPDPELLIMQQIGCVVDIYAAACGARAC